MLFILILGAVLRFQSLDWDSGTHQHPDERFMTMVAAAIEMPLSASDYFNSAESTANPANRGYPGYAYGTAPLFLVRWVAELFGTAEYDSIYLVGRAVSAVLDTATILLLFLTARLFLPRGFSLLAAACYAVTVMAIQYAHFFTVDAAGTLMMMVCLYACLRLICGKQLIHALTAGCALGVGLACRINLLLFVPLVAGCWVLCWKRDGEQPLHGSGRAAVGLLLTLVSAALTVRCMQPYAFDGWWQLSKSWLDQVSTVIQISKGAIEVPYTHQWVDRMRWGFPWINMVRWGMGWPLGLTAWLGVLAVLAAAAFRFHRKIQASTEDRAALFCACWVIWPFFWHGKEYLMTMRYFWPIYPALILLAAWWLMHLMQWIRRTAPVSFLWTAHLPWLVVWSATLLWAFSFSSVYRHTHTRVAASHWIHKAIPSASILAVEHWDDELPLPCQAEGEPVPTLRSITLPLYDPDTPTKLEYLIQALDQADFMILASRRLSDSIPRLPGKYPMTTRYYRALQQGHLGFEPVAEFTSFPSLAGFFVDDTAAEEAFSVYDHPTVCIYSKTPAWNKTRARRQLAEGIAWDQVDHRPAFQIHRSVKPPRLTEDRQDYFRNHGTWSKKRDTFRGLFDRGSWTNRHPIIAWMIMVELLSVLAFPAAFFLFRSLPDRGWLAARVLGPVMMTYAVWLMARSGLIEATPAAVRMVFGAGLFIAVVLTVYSKSLRDAVRTGWRLMAVETGIFWGVFAAFLLLRYSNPDLWHPYFGGEKPMDFAYLNAAVKSFVFPPYNPWCSGESINYYTMGFVMSSVWIKLTGILPAVAYNLIIPTVAAATGVLAFSLGGLLLNTYERAPSSDDGVQSSGASGVYFAAGLIALGLAVFSGNLHEWTLLFQRGVPDWDWFWAASRAIHVPEGAVAPITEFPFFTFLYGDLHAHMLNMPLFLLNLVFAASLVRSPGRGLILCAAALNLGMIRTVNAWDYPASLLILGWAFFISLRTSWSRRILYALLLLLGISVGSYLLFLPFHLDVQSGYGSFKLWTGARTGWADLFRIYGVFLIPLTLVFIWCLAHRSPLREERLTRFLLWLGALLEALAIIAGVEYLVLEGDIGRMNTVFKFYIQVWLLLAPLTGAAAGILWSAILKKDRPAVLLFILCVLVWLASGLYPLLAIPARARCRFNAAQPATLDGAAFMKEAVYQRDGSSYPLRDDAEAMAWIQDQVTGTPVLVEAHLPEYTWGGRYSIHTGLPTPLGWSWHQRQQHAGQPDWLIEERARDVAEIYNTPSLWQAWNLLHKYHAEYLVVGHAERAHYDPAGLNKFTRTNAQWGVAYSNAGVTLYRLLPPPDEME